MTIEQYNDMINELADVVKQFQKVSLELDEQRLIDEINNTVLKYIDVELTED